MESNPYPAIQESYPLAKTLEAIREQKVAAVELCELAFSRIERYEPSVSAWVHLDRASALRRARELDALSLSERGPLHGLPIGVKDIIDVAGMPTKCGSTLRDDTPATVSAPLVKQFEVLGAVVLGKTVTTEFAYFSPGPTRNPRNLDCTPGGSSSGSAAAVACGMVPLALGTQTAASVSRPASYCGTGALIVTRGTLPTSGVTGLSSTLDTMGLLGSDPHGLAEVYRFLEAKAVAATPVTKILRWLPSADFGVDPEYREILDSCLSPGLEQYAVEADQVRMDRLASELIDCHQTVMAYEAVRERATDATQATSLSAELNDLFDTGRSIEYSTYDSMKTRSLELRTEVLELIGPQGVLLTPAAQSNAPLVDAGTGNPLLSRPWQVLGLPVVIHSGFTGKKSGLPLGLQLVGNPGSELSLLKLSERMS